MSDVVVTGIGVVSPLGHSLGELMRRVAAGERAVGDADGVSVGDIPLDAVPAAARARIGRADRLCRLLLAASALAIDDARLALPLAAPERVGLSFGSGLGCLLSDAEFYQKIVAHGVAAASPRVFAYTVSSAAAGEVSIAFGIHGPNVTGHVGLAAGAGAIGYAADQLRLDRADVMLAGGADALGAALSTGLRDMGLLKTAAQARPFLDTVAGVWPSEGAAVLVLERAEHAAARGAHVAGRVVRYAVGFEPTLTRHDPVSTGVAATLQRAVHGAARPHVVLCSAHGTPLDNVEVAALRAVDCAGVPLLASKTALGEAFGASGALAVGLGLALLRGETTLADGVAVDLVGAPLPGRSLRAESALVSAVCYSGNAVGLLLARPE
ncbi:MAG: beta-ketoacyl synthase N-terminal-like domain-containing protein [bacterium]